LAALAGAFPGKVLWCDTALKVPDKAQKISDILLQGRTFIAIKKAFKSTGF
jgi:hypothetical protein